MTYAVAVIGGSGPQGRGLAYRFALAGYDVILGSRDETRALQTAGEINERLPEPRVRGAENVAAIEAAEIVLLAVPWTGHAELVESLSEPLADKVLITCVNPLGFDAEGPYGLVLEESAAEQVQRLVPSAHVVGAFHHVAALSLWKTPDLLHHEDVLVCGNDPAAKALVMEMARAVTGKPGIDVGPVRLARQLEPLTAVLISMNKLHKARTGIAITGIAG